jgi:hypothetical protein
MRCRQVTETAVATNGSTSASNEVGGRLLTAVRSNAVSPGLTSLVPQQRHETQSALNPLVRSV